MRLTELFVPETVVTDMPAAPKDRLLRAIVDDLDSKGLIADRERAAADVVAREHVMTTGVGNGVAIPHAYTHGVDRLVAGCYRTLDPVDFGSVDGRSVDLVFIILGPPESRREHIRVLAKISRLLGHEGFRDDLRRAPDADAVMTVFRRYGER
jgi:mannitol/fructose-specific phosphotransferase system IIA component (Ntr-type)